ncbi:MAG: phosphoribosyl-ATP diphosphatase [Acidiphilium sp. 37-64-53]|uniref:phosphoribosyl-ATP diphosphatase n=1 Tax=Acidiphilium TaxID=522 RepID=UPI000BDC468D|nr:MAG: phosphoribosyl-ATP diphosphatase [Acidiphilium sp. 37-64-53]OZB29929.1 MAG: phosphoribosyl-ATP diphosphatase [Acidiphilium sp. 34-64-41]
MKTGKTKAETVKIVKAKAVKAKSAKAKAANAKSLKAKAGAKVKAAPRFAPVPPLDPDAPDARVMDRLWSTIIARKNADPLISHSARLLSRGVNKVAQKFGEESVECLIEAVAGNREALIAESADVLYHLLVMWVAVGLRPEDVWSELKRREGISGIAEKSARPVMVSIAETRKIP